MKAQLSLLVLLLKIVMLQNRGSLLLYWLKLIHHQIRTVEPLVRYFLFNQSVSLELINFNNRNHPGNRDN